MRFNSTFKGFIKYKRVVLDEVYILFHFNNFDFAILRLQLCTYFEQSQIAMSVNNHVTKNVPM